MLPMITALATSPRKADAPPATSRMTTSGFADVRTNSATRDRSRVVASSLGPDSASRRWAS